MVKSLDVKTKVERNWKGEISKQCNIFNRCVAPLCPLDENIDKRCWYADEKVCRSRIHGNKRWIKKQKSIVQRQIKRWLDRPITYQELYDVSRHRKISQVQKKRLIEMGSEHRYEKGH